VPSFNIPMRNVKIVVVLSVVATILVLGIIIFIGINPLVEIGLAPVLAAISLIIRAIGGDHHDGKDHGPQGHKN
jgi:hypothetical protein